MINKKELKNIQPFDDIFFKRCNYNPLFTALKYYNKDVMPFIINDINLYTVNNNFLESKNVEFYSNYISIKKDEDILSEMGILLKYCSYEQNILNIVKESIEQDIPILIYADAYYCDHYELFYGKSHHSHFFLVCGYNEELKMFSIIDVNHEKTTKKEIKYETLINCYEGYNNYLKYQYENINYVQVIADKNYIKESYDSSIDKYINLYKRNIFLYKDDIINNIEVVKLINENLNSILKDEYGISKNINDLLEAFFFIIVMKKAEKYRIKILFGNKFNLLKIVDQIIKEWEKIKLLSIKYKEKKHINIAIMEKHLNAIYDLEKSYYNELFGYFEIM